MIHDKWRKTEKAWETIHNKSSRPHSTTQAVAMTGAGAASMILGGSLASLVSSFLGSSAVAGVESAAGFSRGATGAGSSIFGGASSTLTGWLSSLDLLGLNKSLTRADRRRPILRGDLVTFSSFSSFLSSSFLGSSVVGSGTGASDSAGASVSLTGSAGASSTTGSGG